VVKADGSQSRNRGFEPRHHKLDGCKHASYYINPKIMKIKVAEWGTQKKYLKKKKKKKKNLLTR
jgi:hypothetical protein